MLTTTSKNFHGGNRRELAQKVGCAEGEILDFSASINPLGPPEYLRAIISRTLDDVSHYPDPYCSDLIQKISSKTGIAPEQIVVGNGSSELLYAIPRALQCTHALIPSPSYGDYSTSAELNNCRIRHIDLDPEKGFAIKKGKLDQELTEGELIFLGQPNNPTGSITDNDLLVQLINNYQSCWFVIDEAFAGFISDFKSLAGQKFENVIIVRSLTKLYSIPALRLGYAIANPQIINSIRRILPPWSVNALAQQLGAVLIDDDPYVKQTCDTVNKLRVSLYKNLKMIPGLTVFPSTANYILVRIDRRDLDAKGLSERLLERRIAIRVCTSFRGLDSRYFRVAVKNHVENRCLIDALQNILLHPSKSVRISKKYPALMFQGTSSNAGKSILTAALCRILTQDGIRVAPFKAQNMSLNSFVTRGGGEMGRAQVVQAQACRIEPDICMNPVLLKPNSDTGAQVIVAGKSVGNMTVAEYIRYKQTAFAVVKESYDSLASRYDAIIIEGAGSPAEVNLKHHDIVNMAMAAYAKARVLLVGDIDRGGVFASFIGTMEVLSERERSMVAGFVVNRFRGKQSLLGSAFDYTLRHTGKPVIGVVPYVKNIGLPEEDSVEFKTSVNIEGDSDTSVTIALIDLPHISNFTDFDALRLEPDVNIVVVRSLKDLVAPDAVIIPGSKNVPGDMAYLVSSGMAAKIKQLALTTSVEIVGICGGFQMLGNHIRDPYSLESSGGGSDCLGLLPMDTTLGADKILKRVEGFHLQSNLPVSGYEIHHGRSTGDGLMPVFRTEDGSDLGYGNANRSIWGTYLHGIFDADSFRRLFVNQLRVKRGLLPLQQSTLNYSIEPALDNLARVVRENLDMKLIYRVMGL